MPHFDKDEVLRSAAGRWREILIHAGGFPAEIMDGRNHPCPRCGGRDRFRFTNKNDGGSCICNQCFRSGGDGLAAMMWNTGQQFKDSLQRVAEYCGVRPAKKTREKKRDPAKDLDFCDWNDQLAGLWCLRKPGIKPEAFKILGAKQASYKGFRVIALPIWGPQLAEADPVGWCLYNLSGGTLPKYDKTGKVIDQVKVKITYGSQAGVIGLPGEATTVWKTEGPTDLLAFLSLDLPADVTGICNANGAKEDPANVRWIAELFAGKTAYVVHDCDQPGQEGATEVPRTSGPPRAGWAPAIAKYATNCRNVVLPYPIAKTSGKDLRDWITAGGDYQGMLELAGQQPEIEHIERKPIPNEAVDDPHRLARVNLERYARHRDGATLRYWRDEWFTWKATRGCYRRIGEKELRAKITAAIKEEFDQINLEDQENKRPGEDDPKVRKVTGGLVANVMNATASTVVISSATEQMTWLDAEGRREKRLYIAMRNGILDLEALMADQDDVMLPHSPNWWSEICLPYNFDPEAECPKWEAFLERNLEMDPERIKMLQEWAGYLLFPDTGEQKFLVLEGEGANGKSVYCAAITAMLGVENTSHIPLEVFGDRFAKTQTLGKLVNICADVGEIDNVAEGYLKSFTSGDMMFFDRKGLPGVDCHPTARMMIACNNLPRFRDRSSGVWRRMIDCPWLVEIPPEERVKNMDKAWWWQESGELPGILNWALVGLHRLRNQRGFTWSRLCAAALETYQGESNPARLFLIEFMRPSSSRVKTSLVYRHYSRWCQENGYRPLNESHFGREVKRVFRGSEKKRSRISGERDYVYENLEFATNEILGESTFESGF